MGLINYICVMSFNINNINNKEIVLTIPFEDSETIFCAIYLKMKQNIYSKISFLEKIQQNNNMLEILYNAYFANTIYNNNFLNIFLEDPNYNIILNERFVAFAVILFDNFSYHILLDIVDNIIENSFIKSQYLEIFIVTDENYHKKERFIYNLTYFLIELFNQKFQKSKKSSLKKRLINSIVTLLDKGIINFYEEKEIRRDDFTRLNFQIDINNDLPTTELLKSERTFIINRQRYLKSILLSTHYMVTNFIDYTIKYFYEIPNTYLYNTIYVFKKNNSFMFQNYSHFISFSKLVMQATIKTNETFIVNYSNFYFSLCKKFTKNNVYSKKISDKFFFDNIFTTAFMLSKNDDNSLYIYLSNICKHFNIVNRDNIKMKRVNERGVKQFIFTILDKIHLYFVNGLNKLEYDRFRHFIEFIKNTDINILISFEIRNIFIEKMFFILDFIFDEQNSIIKKNNYLLENINSIILSLINSKFNYILNYFVYENSELNLKTWERYCNYFKDDNYLVTNFVGMVGQQTDVIRLKNPNKDPITNSIIETPIKLPECNITMDKYVLYRCLMDKEINPFNRKNLSIKDIESNKNMS